MQTLQVENLLANLLSMQEALQFQLLHHLISAKSHKLIGEQSGTLKKTDKNLCRHAKQSYHSSLHIKSLHFSEETFHSLYCNLTCY